jgi:hypothetical protein
MVSKIWRTPCQASTLLHVTLAWVQYQTGRCTPILTDAHTPLPYLTTRWIPSLQTFLTSINGQIELGHNYIPALQCQGIKQAVSQPKLRQYIEEKNNWQEQQKEGNQLGCAQQSNI